MISLFLFMGVQGGQALAQPALSSPLPVTASDAGSSWTASTQTQRYHDQRASLDTTRAALATRWEQGDPTALREAEEVLSEALIDGLIPAWLGTPWAFHGDSTIPGQGEIACGYFVSTILEHAGFRVERVRMAQQASEHIIQSLTPEAAIARFSDRPITDVLSHLARTGDGLYLVGLDFHTGVLVQRAGQTTFCHASYLEPVAVVCEPAETALALESRYRVVGRLLEEEMLTRWLEGQAFATRTR